jgi:hypothetical protein
MVIADGNPAKILQTKELLAKYCKEMGYGYELLQK